jgi:hypothetical protein
VELQSVLEVAEHVAHGGAQVAIVFQAALSCVDERRQRTLTDLLELEMGVDDLVQESEAMPLHGPFGEVDMVAREARIDHWARAEDFEEQNAERVDVGLVGEELAAEVLGVEVAEAALDDCAHVGSVERWPELREAEVRDLVLWAQL